MSEHDPFDGLYDESARQEPLVGAPQERLAQPAQDEDPVPPASEVAHPETYTRSQLERMRKAELQVAARERGLSPAGDRDTLIAAVWAAQQS